MGMNTAAALPLSRPEQRDDDRRRPVIVAARRTPIGRAGGVFAEIDAAALLSPVIRALLDETAIDAASIDEVIVGNAAGGGGNVARLATLSAGLPVEVPGVSVDRQ